MLRKLGQQWKQYKYRFVPWLALSLRDRSVRTVPVGSKDKLLSDDEVEAILKKLFFCFKDTSGDADTPQEDQQVAKQSSQPLSPARRVVKCEQWGDICKEDHSEILQKYDNVGTEGIHKVSNSSLTSARSKYHFETKANTMVSLGSVKHNSRDVNLYCDQTVAKQNSQDIISHHDQAAASAHIHKSHRYGYRSPKEQRILSARNLQIMYDCLGFAVERTDSVIPGAGTGVRVTRGQVPEGAVVALYPGTVYQPYEPIFLPSLGNPFIFRCIDGIHVDGNDKRLSKYIFRSCAQRDRMGPYMTSDMSWLTQTLTNPLAVGQYINNHNKENAPNVAYQEFNVPKDFPFHLLQYVPNIYYSSSLQSIGMDRLMRMVVLVSTRKIAEGEELFSSYFTLVH